jgi:hypothetical protein
MAERKANMHWRLGQFTIIPGARSIVLGAVLMLGPAVRTSAAVPAEPSTSDAEQRAAVVQAPDVELEAIDDTLRYDQHRFAPPNDTGGALTPADGARTARSAAEAELDALTAATLAENAAHGAASLAFARDNGLGGDVPAAEAELHALLAWQDAEHSARSTRATPQTDAVSRHAPPAESHGAGGAPSASHGAAGTGAPTSTDEARAATRLPKEERLPCVAALVSTTEEARQVAGACLPDAAARPAERSAAQTSATPTSTDEARAAIAARIAAPIPRALAGTS